VPSPAGWDEDDEGQAEALRTLQLLGERGNQSKECEGRIQELESLLRAERMRCQELDAQLARERGLKEAAQQQVLCLESELDGKEAALQMADRALERRSKDLQQAQAQFRTSDEPLRSDLMGDHRFSALLQSRFQHRDQQKETKEQHIARLLGLLRGNHEDDDCGQSVRSGFTTSTNYTSHS
jgi:chromosome segregation ATPase